MASPRKMAANRRNAQYSTGPRTAHGKGRSKRNAFWHGPAVRLPAHWRNDRDVQRLRLNRRCKSRSMSLPFCEDRRRSRARIASGAAPFFVTARPISQAGSARIEPEPRNSRSGLQCSSNQPLAGPLRTSFRQSENSRTVGCYAHTTESYSLDESQLAPARKTSRISGHGGAFLPRAPTTWKRTRKR